MLKKYLILKPDSNTFENYYVKKMNLDSCHTERPFKKQNVFLRFLSHFQLPFQSLWFGKWKKDLEKFDVIIIFDSAYSIPYLVKYLKKKTKARIILWFWNPIKHSCEIKLLKNVRTSCEIWTFDEADSVKYNLKLNNQFFFYQKNNLKEKNNVAFFVGIDKGRYDTLLKLGNKLSSKGIGLNFNIISDFLDDQRKFVTNNFMDYEHVLDCVASSKFIVDICQKGQSGLTVRALEAAFFKSKLITNNTNISKYNFYSKNNIFILGVDNDDDFVTFIQNDFDSIPDFLLEQYSFEGWLKNFDK